jgi:hypothetical protein
MEMGKREKKHTRMYICCVNYFWRFVKNKEAIAMVYRQPTIVRLSADPATALPAAISN